MIGYSPVWHQDTLGVNCASEVICSYYYVLLFAYVSALKERLISNVLCWQICSLTSCTVHLFDRQLPASAWRLIVVVSDLPPTSPHWDAWPSPTVADALSTSLSRQCWRNCKILSNALLRCTRKSTHVSYAECSRQVDNRLFTDKLERSWWRLSNRHSAEDVEPLVRFGCHSRLLRCCRRRADDRVTTLLWSGRRYCTTTRCRHLRPDADSEVQSTRRRLYSVAGRPASTTCRRLWYIRDATVSWRHFAPVTSVHHRVDACLSRQTCAGIDRELATPCRLVMLRLFSCLLMFVLLILLIFLLCSHLPGRLLNLETCH